MANDYQQVKSYCISAFCMKKKHILPIILWLKLVIFDAGYNGRLAVFEVVGGKDAADTVLEMVQTITRHLGLD